MAAPKGPEALVPSPTACSVLVVESDLMTQRLVQAWLASLGVTHTHVRLFGGATGRNPASRTKA